jgi:hypothetical protein
MHPSNKRTELSSPILCPLTFSEVNALYEHGCCPINLRTQCAIGAHVLQFSYSVGNSNEMCLISLLILHTLQYTSQSCWTCLCGEGDEEVDVLGSLGTVSYGKHTV